MGSTGMRIKRRVKWQEERIGGKHQEGEKGLNLITTSQGPESATVR